MNTKPSLLLLICLSTTLAWGAEPNNPCAINFVDYVEFASDFNDVNNLEEFCLNWLEEDECLGVWVPVPQDCNVMGLPTIFLSNGPLVKVNPKRWYFIKVKLYYEMDDCGGAYVMDSCCLTGENYLSYIEGFSCENIYDVCATAWMVPSSTDFISGPYVTVEECFNGE